MTRCLTFLGFLTLLIMSLWLFSGCSSDAPFAERIHHKPPAVTRCPFCGDRQEMSLQKVWVQVSADKLNHWQMADYTCPLDHEMTAWKDEHEWKMLVGKGGVKDESKVSETYTPIKLD